MPQPVEKKEFSKYFNKTYYTHQSGLLLSDPRNTSIITELLQAYRIGDDSDDKTFPVPVGLGWTVFNCSQFDLRIVPPLGKPLYGYSEDEIREKGSPEIVQFYQSPGAEPRRIIALKGVTHLEETLDSKGGLRFKYELGDVRSCLDIDPQRGIYYWSSNQQDDGMGKMLEGSASLRKLVGLR